ncbi:ExbD/TolR family protein [Thermochromatium tepidum]|uniref:ExbD/TolR family protein n=1 Tax=Thermochromatium tepidum TaxID=1050 RepID=UPI001FE8F219|nr:biopolymer transporter ExbD [Thermochromatium tepidum]
MPRRPNPIGLTPLIDVVFILLLFFLLASHFEARRALPIDATQTALAETADSDVPSLSIRLHADGHIDLGDVRLEQGAVVERLRDRLRQQPELRVLIHPDAEVELQALVSLMDRILALGVTEVTLE